MTAQINNRMAITGLGAVCSVGYDVVTAMASIRCGLKRPDFVNGFTVHDKDEMTDISLMAYPIKGVTDGYQGLGLLARIAVAVIEDLAKFSKFKMDDSRFWSETSLVACVSKVRNPDLEVFDEIVEDELASVIIRECGLAIAPVNCKVICSGHAGVLTAVNRAESMLSQGGVKRVIVLGVDSLVGRDDVAYFYEKGWLKVEGVPSGLQPGEAGAAIMLELEHSALRRNADIHAYVSNVNTSFEENHRMQEDVNTGKALSSVVLSTLASKSNVESVYCDLNGMSARSMEWGLVLAKLQRNHDVSKLEVNVPASSIGDTGAASGAISICAAVRHLARSYTQEREILVWSSSDSGEVASALIWLES